MKKYPVLTINLKHMQSNYKHIIARCKQFGIVVSGVVKASDDVKKSYSDIANIMMQAGCIGIADSRLKSIIALRQDGFTDDIMLLRVPMLSELEDVVKYVDVSMQSEPLVIAKTQQIAAALNKVHRIILMMDLGDLREGFFDEKELIEMALTIESDYPNLKLYGIGTNLSCYGSIKPDTENLGRLIAIAKSVEVKIGRKLDIVSGGATTSLPLVYNGQIPAGINHLRIGEGALLARDLIDIWEIDMPGLYQDIYTLEGEIIEIKDKPTHPIGQLFIDAFGYRPTYQDIGIRKRALIALGKRDFGSLEGIVPVDPNIKIFGASSDHLIVDITDCDPLLKIGDIVKFDCYYQAMVFCNHSPYVEKQYIK